MRAEKRIDYIEIPVTDLNKARDFFSALFGWSFEKWGDDYMSFSDGRLDGGFRRSADPAPATGVLVIYFWVFVILRQSKFSTDQSIISTDQSIISTDQSIVLSQIG